MKAKYGVLLFIAIQLSPLFSQQVKNSKATSSGTCAIAHVGNADVINITNCGIGKQQGDKIIELLKQIGANEQKLDQVLKIVSASPHDDVVRNLTGVLSLPEDKNLDNAQFVLTNNSSQSIHVNKVSCRLLHATFGHSILSGIGLRAHPDEINLGAGGDAQEYSCPFSHFIRGAPKPDCAEVAWIVEYAIDTEPSNIQPKAYRFSLGQGDTKWHRTADTAPIPPCNVQ